MAFAIESFLSFRCCIASAFSETGVGAEGEKNSDSFYEIYEDFLGKDPVFETEEEINQEKLPGPIATTKTDSWRIVAKDYHKPISAAFFAENDQFIQTEMLKLQAAGYDVSETKDNHKINLNSNKDSLEKSVCL